MAAKRPPNSVEVTPSGIEIEFWDSIGVDGQPQQRRYRVNGEKFVSVSTVAGVYEKWALTPAAVKLTEHGVIALAQSGIDIAAQTQESLRALMIERGLHFDSVWGVARERGDIAHDMLVRLVRDGKVPRLSQFPADIRPWISAGLKWFMQAQPKVLDAERMVASAEHAFAGRFDLLCELRDGRIGRVDYKTVTEWKERRDYKGKPTGKLLPPYDENLIAVEGYEIGAVESGYDASDVRLIVRLGPDGDYDVCESWADADHFLCALEAYRSRKRLTAGEKRAVAA